MNSRHLMIKKVIWRSFLVLVVSLVVFVFFKRRFIIGAWQYGRQARDGTLSVGDVAPQTVVWELDGTTSSALADRFGSKPVAIVFGSFT